MRPISRAHPDESALHALLDGELGWCAALRLRLHLRRCAPCRALRAEVRARDAMITAVIRRASPAVDVHEAWARFVVRSGGGVAHAPRAPRAWSLAPALLVILGMTLVSLRHTIPRPFSAGTRVALEHTAHITLHGQIVRDACCQDHDGGDLPDDGLLTLSRPGQHVTIVVIYEDVDHSGTFTPGDIVRYRSTTPHP